jgi:hypothetical protein
MSGLVESPRYAVLIGYMQNLRQRPAEGAETTLNSVRW